MRHLPFIIIITSFIISIFLIPLSWLRFISFGLDFQQEKDGQVYQHFFHLQMIGNGSFGLDVSYYPVDFMNEPLDLGAAFNHQVRRPRPRHFLNYLGFWRLEARYLYRKTSLGYYWGVPIWIPFLINSIILLLYLKCKRE